MKKLKVLFLSGIAIFMFCSQSAAQSVKNVILISLDGAQYNHMAELLNAGLLPNIRHISLEGKMSNILISPFIKKSPEGNGTSVKYEDILAEDEIYYEMAVTDSGHARMLTGEWSLINGICEPYTENPLIDFLCANNFQTVADGLTVMEKIKAENPDYFVASVVSRHGDMRDKLGKGYLSIFKYGSDEILTKTGDAEAIGGHGYYGTTFENAEADLDYFFDSHKIPGDQLEANWKNSYFYTYDPVINKVISLEEFNADAIAQKANGVIAYCVGNNRPFFMFVHLCEPDLFGHIYGENSAEYSQAIMIDDAAIGKILATLKLLGKYDETMIIVTTDHGATENASAAITYPYLGKTWLLALGMLHGALTADNHWIWMANNKFKDVPVMEQTRITSFILEKLGIN
jgi:predicted AlkP superfamily pyrophosphatase or phosphodiesterase